jgi:cytochrome c-type biogenesis protein CcmH/NrfG
MKSDAIAYGIAGISFGLITGWIIGSQQARTLPPPLVPRAAEAPAESGAGTAQFRQAPPLDEGRVKTLRDMIEKDPKNAAVLAELANVYYDAERFEDAITFYERALAIRPKDVNVSTDLGVSYYYTNQADRALKQFDYSLSVDPSHTKTILNVGIVRAFAKQDLAGAAQAWQRVVDLAPGSAEAQAARRALESMKAAHPAVGGQSTNPGGSD